MFKELPPPTGVEEEKPEGSPTEETGEEGAEETGSTKAADDSDPNPESAEGTAEATEPKAPALPHLASMGWRICANPIKKRHIVVRYLGRLAIDDVSPLVMVPLLPCACLCACDVTSCNVCVRGGGLLVGDRSPTARMS